MDLVITAIRQIRNRRAEMNVPPSKKAKMYICSTAPEAFCEKTSYFFEKLAGASEAEYPAEHSGEGCVQIISDKAIIYIPLDEMVDFEKETARLTAEKEKLLSEIERIDKKLANEGFVAKAPAAVIEGERKKREAMPTSSLPSKPPYSNSAKNKKFQSTLKCDCIRRRKTVYSFLRDTVFYFVEKQGRVRNWKI